LGPGVREDLKARHWAASAKGKQEVMEFTIIDNNERPMTPDQGRGLGFVQALTGWMIGKDYEFVRYDDASRLPQARRCRGLILTGSGFDFALPDDSFDREAYRKMIPVFQLIRDFNGPVLGICFGHQLMALAEEFDPDRTAFGRLRVRNMPDPPDKHLVVQIRMNSSLRFMNQMEVWVQFHHKQEVLLNDDLLRYFEVAAGSTQCLVQAMQHRSRDWFGVQFHPEIGRVSRAGEVTRHQDAVSDGQALLQDFARYCLR